MRERAEPAEESGDQNAQSIGGVRESIEQDVQATTQPTSGESRRQVSWLWYQGGLESQGDELSQDMNDDTYRGTVQFAECSTDLSLA